jgi:membrane protein YdbS with pleckstrin-like domain
MVRAGEAAFAPPGTPWTPVSPRLATLRRSLLAVLVGVAALGLAAIGVVGSWWWLAALALVAGAVAVAWGWRLVGRNVASWGYAERDEDLLVRHGVFYRQLVVVPYGRMQFVDVTAGPLDRRFGLASVQLHTASAATDARIPGLVPDEAARLRDRLASQGEARAAGL